jgi:hypothetical protein
VTKEDREYYVDEDDKGRELIEGVDYIVVDDYIALEYTPKAEDLLTSERIRAITAGP